MAAEMNNDLFPAGLPLREFAEFPAQGYGGTVPGVVYSGKEPPECGVPLGGIDTGCLDLEATGLLGFATIFNSLFPRRGPIAVPFLGLTTGARPQRTWLMTTVKYNSRKSMDLGNFYLPDDRCFFAPVESCDDIRYWGHYPIVDMEYETSSPIRMGLRAWSPFIPGDTAASNVPGAVFEVQLRNPGDVPRDGAVTFNFPGPSAEEAGSSEFQQRKVSGTNYSGLQVSCSRNSYVLAVLGKETFRCGGDLGVSGHDWQAVREYLPPLVGQAGTSISVDFKLEPGESRVIRFALSWYAPEWRGGGRMNDNRELFGEEYTAFEWMGGAKMPPNGNSYLHMYAARFSGAEQVAEYLADNHDSLLSRIIGWQSAIYSDGSLPVWLRDSLVNILHLITETSVWAQAKPPIGDWCRQEDGLFAMNESPRWCPQLECIPCSYFGNLPLVYFFPELVLSTMRGYKAYQYPDGAVPFVFGGSTVGGRPYELTEPSRGYAKKPQSTLDGACYVEIIDKLWQRTGDDRILREFYESAKANTIFTMNLRPGSGDAGVVSMPEDNNAYDWYEACDLYGIVPHIGGIHLAQLRMMVRMAEAVGDRDFADRCRKWIEGGSRVLEEHTWNDSCYLLFNELETGKKSDLVLAYQLDGEWICRFHGVPGAFRPDRVKTTLATLQKTSLAMGAAGAVTFCRPTTEELDSREWSPGYWGTRGVHPPGTWVLGMLYIYEKEKEVGLEISGRVVKEVVRRGWYWDWAVCMDSARNDHEGYDYYQNMMIWSLPAALDEGDIAAPCRSGGLAARVLEAGRAEKRNETTR